MTQLLRVGAFLLALLGLLAMLATLPELQDGILEAPKHWWSTVPFLILAAAGGLWLAARRRAAVG